MGSGILKVVAASLSLLAANALAAEPLRTVHDASRNRVWVLESDALYLHQGAQKQRYELPGWIYASEPYACSPDLTVDGQGSAVASSPRRGKSRAMSWRSMPTATRTSASAASRMCPNKVCSSP